MKKICKIVFILTFIVFLLLYFSYKNGYYEHLNEEKHFLTEEKIKEYEEDLKNGIDVSTKNYTIIKPSYDNKYTRTCLKISNKIEKTIDKIIKFFFRKVNSYVDE